MRLQPANRMRIGFGHTALLLAGLLSILGAVALAGPEGATVVHGTATFQQSGNYTAIEASNRAIINYSSFDVARPETVEFLQPGVNATVLNRILSANPTTIDGTILANGRVFFVNPAGVVFGESAQVNVAQLVASALDIRNADFLDGRYDFKGGEGSVINHGQITADRAYLIGRQVANFGTIDCPGGYVVMAAGDRVFLGEPGANLLVEIDGSAAPEGSEPKEGVAVLNEGTIEAAGGTILLAAAGDIYAHAISNVGKLSASATKGDAGTVKLSAPEGTVVHTGSIEAVSESGRGGNVQLLGDRVGLFGSGRIDASGATGGGSILVGGDYKGQGEVPTASRTSVGTGASLHADATMDGDGGKIIVWSDEVTKFSGHAGATGAGSGDGGFIEVSGKQDLSFTGTATLGAPHGNGGTLLLDPAFITIVDGAGEDEPPQDDLTFNDQFYDPAISEATLENTAAGSNAEIVLESYNTIVMEDLSDNALTLSPGVSLVLRTRNNPGFEDNRTGGISTNTGDSIVASGGGTLTLQGGHDGTGFVANSAAHIHVGSLVTDGGSVTVQSTGEISLINITTAGAANAAGGIVLLEAGLLTASHYVDVHGTIDTSGGPDADASGANPAGSVDLSGGTVYIHNIIATGGDDNGGDAPGGAGGSVRLGAPTTIRSQGSSLRTSGGDGSTPGAGGDVTFNGSLVLYDNLTITAGSGDVVFQGTVDRGFSEGPTASNLVVNSGGTTRFEGVVGGGEVPIDSLTTDAAGTTEIDADITTGGELMVPSPVPATQIYNDAVVFTNDATLTDNGTTGIFFNGTVSGDGTPNLWVQTTHPEAEIQFNDAVTWGGYLEVETAGGDVTFQGTIDGAGGETEPLFYINSAGITRFGATVGGLEPIGHVHTDAPGTTEINADITTNGSSGIGTQIYNDPVVLTNSVTLADTGENGIYFNDTVSGDGEGPWDLTVHSAATIQFNGQVSLDGGLAAAATGDIWAEGLTSARNNIELRSTYGSLLLQGDINAYAAGEGYGGGVSLIADEGQIGTHIGDGVVGALNVTITGYSDGIRGVSLPYSESARTAIRIESGAPLRLGSRGALIARGNYTGYIGDVLPSYTEWYGEDEYTDYFASWVGDQGQYWGEYHSYTDDRGAVGFSTEDSPSAPGSYSGGRPIDVAVYLRSSSEGPSIDIDAPVIMPDGATMVLDGYDTITIGETFRSNSVFPGTSRLEIVSRITTDLTTETSRARFPYDIGEPYPTQAGEVAESRNPEWFDGFSCVLRGGNESAVFLATGEYWYEDVYHYDLYDLFSISGTSYIDQDGDGLIEGDDTGLGGVVIFIDMDGSGTWTEGDLTTATGSSGDWGFDYRYYFGGEGGGYYSPDIVGLYVYEVVPSGYEQTLGQEGYWIHGDGSQFGLNFANYLLPAEEPPLPPPLPIIVTPDVVPPIPAYERETTNWVSEAENIIGPIVPPHPECMDVKEEDIDILRKCQVACDLFSTDVSLNVVAEDLVSLNGRLKAHVQQVLSGLDSLSRQWPRVRPDNVPAIEQMLAQDGALGQWVGDGTRFVMLQVKLGRPFQEAVDLFLVRHLELAGADEQTLNFMQNYLKAKIVKESTGMKPTARAG